MSKPARHEMAAELYAGTATEAQFQAAVVELATALGWLAVHFRQMLGNPAGYPDLTLLRDDRYVLAELKSETGKVSIKQQMWHAEAARRGVTVYVWRPSSWPEIQEILR